MVTDHSYVSLPEGIHEDVHRDIHIGMSVQIFHKDFHRKIMRVRIDIRILFSWLCQSEPNHIFLDDNYQYQILQYYMSHPQNSMSFGVQCLVHFHALSRRRKNSHYKSDPPKSRLYLMISLNVTIMYIYTYIYIYIYVYIYIYTVFNMVLHLASTR